ncbi:flavin-containing monooxygenase [Pontibacter arcticus]|uniref:Oxidoreductase n=1 Tax=Pontibacter arcticus TaxID=2080288 RepID=A0A364RDU7_9BACT|nr:NAD(P)/FAD-dependent oxidoreductase [Pontibacter arcticus]RAU82520.1 oxidoreductase [Pontibacter arcticus]
METEVYDVLVIGGGQAGLAMGYHLQKANLNFVILDAGNALGESWRKRYESLRLFTPSRYNGLAGLPFPGTKDRFPGKNEVADYLQEYARHFNLPVLLQQRAEEVYNEAGQPDIFTVRTTANLFYARQVVVCTGAFHQPKIPAFADRINPAVQQLHTSQYQTPAQLQPGKVAVVGGGNSGVQVAEELVQAGREVYFSFRGKLKSQANTPFSMQLLFASGLMHAGKYSWVGSAVYRRPEAIMSTNLKRLFSQPNIKQVGAALQVVSGGLVCEKEALTDVAAIIWATGFKSDFSWIKLPVVDMMGTPVHQRGITKVPGLYFLGLPWLHSRSSGLLGGVSRDAAFLASAIKKQHQQPYSKAGVAQFA